MKVDSLRKLWISELKDLYSAETQLIKALEKMSKKATNPDLKQGFLAHLKETKGQRDRLQLIFKNLEYGATGEKCKAMAGLISEGEELMEEVEEPAALDAALILAAQKVEHYEIASYGAACEYAKLLGEDEAQAILHETLEEEKATNEKLMAMAKATINEQAMAG